MIPILPDEPSSKKVDHFGELQVDEPKLTSVRDSWKKDQPQANGGRNYQNRNSE